LLIELWEKEAANLEAMPQEVKDKFYAAIKSMDSTKDSKLAAIKVRL